MPTLIPDPSTLLDAAAALNALPLDRTFDALVERIRELLAADTAAVLSWDASARISRVRAAAGDPGEASLARRALELGTPQFAAAAVAVPVVDGVRPLTLQAGWLREVPQVRLDAAARTLTQLAALTGIGYRAGGEASARSDRVVLDAVLEAAGDGILIERDGRWIANRAAQRLLALPDEQLPAVTQLGAEHLDGTPIVDGDPLPERFRVRVTSLAGASLVLDGSYSVEPLPVIVFRDVTEEHRRETETAEYLRSLLDTIPTAICVVERDTRRVLSVNRAFLKLVGRTEDQVVGALRPYPWWSPGEEPRPIEEEPYPRIFRHADGTPVPVEIEIHDLRDGNGCVFAHIGVITDLTERRRFQQQLLQSGKLAAIGELAAGVAHEVNNPLFAILGLVEFLLKDIEVGTKAHDRLQLIQSTALEIKEIVRSLLDFARESSNERAVIALDEVVRETVTLVARTTAGHGVEVVEQFGEGPFRVDASPNQLKQVFLNLIANARQAMPAGGTVTIALSADADVVEAVVSDTGEGIDPEDMQRIFEPFFTTKRDQGGTGLGLSVSVGIAETHGGSLTAASTPGAGASFTLRLPRHM